MKVLVTGATGFLGTHLCAALEKTNDQVVAVSTATCNLSDPSAIFDIEGGFERIYHLAAWTRAGDFCLWHQAEQWLVNQQINTTVLEYWVKAQPQATLIAIGTSCAYGETTQTPLKETDYLSGVPRSELYAYASTKRALLVGLQSLHRQYGMHYLYCIPATLYGPGYHRDGRPMHFIFDLVAKLIRAKQSGLPPAFWGNGYQRRELTYVDDFVRILLHLPDRCQNEIVNCGGEEDYTLRDYVTMICNIISYDPKSCVWDESRYAGTQNKSLDSSKLRDLVPGWRRTNIMEGLTNLIEWMMSEGKTNLKLADVT